MKLSGIPVGQTLMSAQDIIGQRFARPLSVVLNGSNSPLGGRECCVNGYYPNGQNYNEAMLLEGVFAAVTTCFYPDGRPYWRKLEHNMDRYSLTAMSGMVLLGSTGEAVMLSDDESREVLRVARGAAAAEKVLLAGVGRESVIETLRLADYAAELTYDAVLVRTPHFYRKQMREREMLTYYQAVADRSPLPVLLYSVPGCTAYDLPIAVVAELAMHPNIIGMKDSSGNVERIGELVNATRSAKKRTVPVTTIFAAVTSRMLAPQASAGTAMFVAAGQLASGGTAIAVAAAKPALKTRTREVGFQLLAGSAQTLYPSLEAGATGGVLALATFAPQAACEVYTAWAEKDPVLGADKQQRIAQAGIEVCGKMGIPGVKYALDLNGYFGGRPRMPLLPLNAEEQRVVESLLEDVRN
jgi:4-hydroxy-2-oxoglutarate aldolase